MGESTRDRDETGQYADRIPPDAALEPFEEREDLGRPLTASDVMDALDCSRRTAHNKLNALVDADRLKTRKIGSRGRVWWTPVPSADVEYSSRETASELGDGSAAVDVRTAINDADLPGTGSTLEARRDALFAAYEYLTENPSASRSNFLDSVYPDHPAGFETADGWWNAIQPALKELPGVDPPEERGHLWRFLGRDRFKPTLG